MISQTQRIPTKTDPKPAAMRHCVCDTKLALSFLFLPDDDCCLEILILSMITSFYWLETKLFWFLVFKDENLSPFCVMMVDERDWPRVYVIWSF
jgi:hypothetical protein